MKEINHEYDHAQKLIDSIDKEKIADYLIKEELWHDEAAMKAVNQYQHYLFLIVKYGHHQSLPPSFEIDAAWRAHILSDLDKFLELKKQLFGENKNILKYRDYFYGNKFHSLLSKNTYEKVTKPLYFKEFKETLPTFQTINFFTKHKRFIFNSVKQGIYSLILILLTLFIFLVGSKMFR